MAQKPREEGEGGLGGLNIFSNDGSFMEQFMKMQQQGQKKEEGGNEGGEEGGAKSKTSGITMKLGSVKKATPTSLVQKRLQSHAARTAFGRDSDSEGEGEGPNIPERKGSATPIVAMATPTQTAQEDVASSASTSSQSGTRKRRRSKWDIPSSESSDSVSINQAILSFSAAPQSSSQGQQQLTAAQQQQLKEQIEMNRLVAEIKAATQKSGNKKNKYEYDSDEETEGGTWEHKARTKEMRTTEEKAQELTQAGKGKHHIGDFLPPEELDKFVETVSAVKEDRTPDFSDYKQHKLAEDNKGFQMLQKAGWTEGAGLGAQSQGITAPVNKGKQSFDQSGVGAAKPADVKKEDDEFELYRKRMMLAYRFRPNPLNNPRRPYY